MSGAIVDILILFIYSFFVHFLIFLLFILQKVWFQNQRAKWKKKKKTPATGHSSTSPGTSSNTPENYSDFGGNDPEIPTITDTNWLLNTNLNITNDWNPETFDILLTWNTHINFHSFFQKVWFQNRRAKWKKQRKCNSMLHSPTTLLPSHSLPPIMPSFSHGWGSAAAGYSGAYCMNHCMDLDSSNFACFITQAKRSFFRRRLCSSLFKHWKS